MTAELQRDTIYFGTQTLLVVEVSNGARADWPVVEPVDGLRISHYGSPNLIRDLFRGTIRRSFRFLISPQKPGVFHIRSVSLKTDGSVLKQGPFVLRVIEAPLKHRSTNVEPSEIRIGDNANLEISYQGVRPGMVPTVPKLDGLSIRLTGTPQVKNTQREGLPITTYSFEVQASELGTYQIKGIVLDGVPAHPVTLTVSPFVIVGTQVGEESLVVHGQTTVHVAVRGLSQSDGLKLVAPAGLRVVPARQRYRGPAGATVFSFDVTPAEPGTLAIKMLQMPDGTKIPLDKPITLSVRQSGEGGILACRGIPRSEETVIGEPVIVDYEVFFRGDLRGAGIDTRGAGFADKPYIKVQPVNDVSYPDWSGERIEVSFGEGRAIMLSGSGDFNGRKEQLLRFALKITPLAAGDLSLDGLRVVVLLQIKEERRTGFSFFSTSQTQRYERLAEVPSHRVIEPPGKTTPPGYRGAVGTSFAFSTELDRTKATAMSPLTLTMKITSDNVGPQFNPPLLAEVEELTRQFEVSKTIGGGEVAGNTITFTQVVRPRSESVKELPALPLVYYDYQKKNYDKVYSLPIPLHVTPGSLVGAGEMQVTAMQEAPRPADTATIPSPDTERITLGANHTSIGEVMTAEPLGPMGVLAVLIGGPLCVLLIWAAQQVHQRRQPLGAIRHQRHELTAALNKMNKADHFYEELARLLQSYLRLTFNLPSGEISASMLAEVFAERSTDDNLLREVEDLLAHCDAGRFAVGSGDEAQKNRLVDQARQLFSKLDRCAT